MCHLQTPTALSHGEFDSRLRKSLSEERVATLIPGVYPHSSNLSAPQYTLYNWTGREMLMPVSGWVF